jgi:ketosteroid isomerase-like protein
VTATSTIKLLEAFGQAWNDHDLDAALALTTDDCIFESTSPAPDGARAVGHAALREAWAPIFADFDAQFEVEELVAFGDRALQRWTYRWNGGHVRGVDVFTVRDGMVAEKLSYVKG